jgi:hypothetical protein
MHSALLSAKHMVPADALGVVVAAAPNRTSIAELGCSRITTSLHLFIYGVTTVAESVAKQWCLVLTT